jgi:hypothetical protein
LRKEITMRWPELDAWDQRDNEASRLPFNEEVHLGGLVLSEAFPPSTAATLYKALGDFPTTREKKQELMERLTKSRSAAGTGGWVGMSLIHRRDESNFKFGRADTDLPDNIEAVWLYIHFLTPSLTVVVATFVLTDQSGNLSDILRAAYHTEMVNPSIRVSGPFGGLRAHIPWARPERHSEQVAIRRALQQKQSACEAMIERHEKACWDWFTNRFPGRFSVELLATRPTLCIFLTNSTVAISR